MHKPIMLADRRYNATVVPTQRSARRCGCAARRVRSGGARVPRNAYINNIGAASSAKPLWLNDHASSCSSSAIVSSTSSTRSVVIDAATQRTAHNTTCNTPHATHNTTCAPHRHKHAPHRHKHTTAQHNMQRRRPVVSTTSSVCSIVIGWRMWCSADVHACAPCDGAWVESMALISCSVAAHSPHSTVRSHTAPYGTGAVRNGG